MWAAILTLLIVWSAHSAYTSAMLMDSRALQYVIRVRSGGLDTLQGGSPHRDYRTSEQKPAWSLPWTPRRRRGLRNKAGGVETVPKAQVAVAKAYRPAAFANVLVSVVGVVLLGGGSFTAWPPAAMASPFDPRPLPKSRSQQFFEGWFIRLVDHEQRLSFAVIFGSFKSGGEDDLDQHYVSLSYLHEPLEDIPSAQDDVDRSEDVADQEAADDDKNLGGADAQSPQARMAARGQQFAEWIAEQRLMALRGFGVYEDDGASSRLEGDVGGQHEAELAEGDISDTVDRVESFDGGEEHIAQGDNSKIHSGRDASADDAEVDDPTRVDDLRRQREVGGDAGPGQAHEDPDVLRHAQGVQPGNVGRSTFEQDALADKEGDGGARLRQEHRTGWEVENDEEAYSSSLRFAKGKNGDKHHRSSRCPTPSVEKGSQLNSHDSAGSAVQNGDPQFQHTSGERTYTFHAFPSPDTVTILQNGKPVQNMPNLRDDPSFTWEADGIGSFTVDGDTGRLSFQLPELSVAASFRNRRPWSEDRPNGDGPEGWLARTGLLPLHYFVYTLGSEAGYSLKAADASRAVVGRGSMHMETNYGTYFPTAWVWAQGCSDTKGLCGDRFRDGNLEGVAGDPNTEDTSADYGAAEACSHVGAGAQFVLTGGRFVIGPFTTTSYVLAFRSDQHQWDFRTTDLDRIEVDLSRAENRLKLVARSWGGKRMLELDIKAPEGSFGSAIYVPTLQGFSNNPGCVESYAATARFRLFTKGGKGDDETESRSLVLREEVEIKLAALEFGGEYQDT